jgi:hypothetical protein
MVICLISLGFTRLPLDIPNNNRRGEDLSCYRSIADGIRSGEAYYQATFSELRTRGYPTTSIFNWRTPLLGWAFGHLPDLRIAQMIAIFLSLFSICIWINITNTELSFAKATIGSFLFLGAPIYSFLPDIYLAHEFWAGILISISILTYVKGWRWIAFVAGILALIIRELALPFILLMLMLSLNERKYKEASIWVLGIVLFIFMMVIHTSYIKDYVRPDNAYAFTQWITLGGWKFVLETSSMHPYLFLAPSWFTAVFVPFTLLGLLGWKGPLGSRIGLTVGIYVLIFLFIGQNFNRYWGVLYVNLLPLGILYMPEVVGELFKKLSLF